MKRHPSEIYWMHRKHHLHVDTIHLHPIRWLTEHPLVLALLIVGLIAAAIIALASRIDTGIRIDTLRPLDYPAMYPYRSGAP